MKALVLNGPDQPFEITEIPDPIAGPGEAIAKVFACGSGLTIQHVKAGRMSADFPRIIGHEISAEIVEVGSGVSGLKIGDGVTSYYYINCGHCRWCLSGFEPLCENCLGNVGRECDGGYAEYIKLPAHLFVKFPDAIDYRNHPAEMGVTMDALTTPYKVLKRGRVRPGETVAVFGAGGGVGIHQLMLAKWANARVIAVDIAKSKFQACRDAGAEEVIDPQESDVVEALMDFTNGKGVDVAIDYVSSSTTLEAAAASLGRHGRMVTLGGAGGTFQVNAHEMLLKEQDLLGSRYATRIEILETYDLVARGELWPIVTDIRPMEEAEAIHERVENGEVTGRAAILIQ